MKTIVVIGSEKEIHYLIAEENFDLIKEASRLSFNALIEKLEEFAIETKEFNKRIQAADISLQELKNECIRLKTIESPKKKQKQTYINRFERKHHLRSKW